MINMRPKIVEPVTDGHGLVFDGGDPRRIRSLGGVPADVDDVVLESDFDARTIRVKQNSGAMGNLQASSADGLPQYSAGLGTWGFLAPAANSVVMRQSGVMLGNAFVNDSILAKFGSGALQDEVAADSTFLAHATGGDLGFQTMTTLFSMLGQPGIITSTQDLTPTTTTYQNITNMSWAVEASKSYFLFGFLAFDSTATADWKMQFTGPSLATCYLTMIGGRANIVLSVSGFEAIRWTAFAQSQNMQVTSSDNVGFFGGLVTVSSNAGTVDMQCAQNTADTGTNKTKVYAGSCGWMVPIA